jgi:hypothetical protein
MFGTLVAATVAVYYKPDTRYVFHGGSFFFRLDEFRRASSIQTWALVEAKKRMEARGEATDYVPKP